ncbi:dephospho-CoA kinase [Qipengyuania sp. DSG2-2]|uniref:dephospho-CoA kinase n=1 Tax=Qipengyuania sp. DGS2-2 TaxID=3349631 RepID=UPI0036D3EEA8
MTKPLILGLTGSIGMGKSTVAQMFVDLGIPMFDADAEVRRLQGPGGALLPDIEAAFPGSTGPDGVDRDALGTLVFNNPEKLAVLEGIVHPAVAKVRAEFMEAHRDAPMVLFDIPLLFEKGGFTAVDHIVVVSAPAETQRERVLARPDMTVEKFEKILGLQVPDAEKRERADTVIDTGQSLEATRAEVEALVARLSAN